jgi:predicted nucleic acid-binding protein
LIAVDSSSMIAYLSGASGRDVAAIEQALANQHVVVPPVVLTELLSDPELPSSVTQLFLDLPRVEMLDGYWERAGTLRANVIRKRRRARLADSLVAQSCLDHDLPLITRDKDFRAFTLVSPLRLIR